MKKRATGANLAGVGTGLGVIHTFAGALFALTQGAQIRTDRAAGFSGRRTTRACTAAAAGQPEQQGARQRSLQAARQHHTPGNLVSQRALSLLFASDVQLCRPLRDGPARAFNV